MRVYSLEEFSIRHYQPVKACPCGCLIDLPSIIRHNGSCPDCGDTLLRVPQAEPDAAPVVIPPVFFYEDWPSEWFD